MAVSSCSDALDISPDGKLDESEIWLDNAKVGAYVNTCYESVTIKGPAGWFFQTNLPIAMADDAWDCDAEVETTLSAAKAYNGEGSSSSHPLAKQADGSAQVSWGGLWQGIYRCNNFLMNIDDATVKRETDRARWTAEVHALRAYYYSELFRYWGAQIPLITMPQSYTSDFSVLKRASNREIVDFILADCDSALMCPNLPVRVNGSEASRMTKAIVWAIQSRYSLYAASPLFATGQRDAMTWEEAYQINKKALDSLRANDFEVYSECKNPATFDVYTASGQIASREGALGAATYQEYACTNADYGSNPRDKETIWEARGAGGAQPWVVMGVGFQNGYRCGLVPTQELVDEYENIEVVDGQIVASYPLLDLAKPYLDEQHLQPNYNPENRIYDPQNPFVNKDPRFYATVVYNECKRTCYWANVETDGRSGMTYGPGVRTKTIWTNKEDNYTGIHANARQQTRTGYYSNKYLEPTAGQGGSGGAFAKQKFFRFGEVVLNTAEAAINADRVDEGIGLVNEIRMRVGMPAWPLGLSKEDALLRCKHERRIEFALEDTRYDDIRRWQKPTGNLADHSKWLTALEISWKGLDMQGEDIYTYTRRTIRPSARGCWENKWLLLPVPLSEQRKLEMHTGETWQNPGW